MSIDTEEDSWLPHRGEVSLENIGALPKLESLFSRFGVRATYFTTYQVAISDTAAGILRGLKRDAQREGRELEIGGHLHPWNTPPITESTDPQNSMLHNLPADLQRRKIEAVTHALTEAFDEAPTSFRAGRLGIGQAAVEALSDLGYIVESSVLPFSSLKEFDSGPDFRGAPDVPYRISGKGLPRVPDPNGDMIELPLSVGYNRKNFELLSRVHPLILGSLTKMLRLPGIAARTGLVQKIMLSPEQERAKDMIRLTEAILKRGTPYLHMYMHSSTCLSGLTPFTPTQSHVDDFFSTIDSYLSWLVDRADVEFMTVAEAGLAFTSGFSRPASGPSLNSRAPLT